MRTYEVMTIHRPELGEDEVESRVDGIAQFLTERGATINNRDLWGKRRFAYEIDHLHDGFYSVVTFQAEPEAISELHRMLSLADEVIRHKIVHPEKEPASEQGS
jgi:small subunit ribosomal protein S6